MNYFLDTNVWIDILKGNQPLVRQSISLLHPGHIKVASVTKAELLVGALKTLNPAHAQHQVKQLLLPFEVLPFDDACTLEYFKILVQLEKNGQLIGRNNMLIAATCVAHNGTMVTANDEEFEHISGLRVENWRKNQS